MKKKELRKYIKTQYKRDKRWCVEYHNAGVIEMYNMIFGRLQSLVGVDTEFKLGLGLLDDIQKNVPWNRKMLAGYINNTAEFNPEDVENGAMKKTRQEQLVEFFETISTQEEMEDWGCSMEEQSNADVAFYRNLYNIPDDYDWDGRFVEGVGVWVGNIFLFSSSGRYIGRSTRNNVTEFKFDDTLFSFVIGSSNYEKYFK